MNILHVAAVRSDRPSGVSAYALGLLEALGRNGRHRYGLLPVLPGVDPRGAADLPNVTLLAPPAHRGKNPWYVDASWLERLQRGFGRPDLVHFHGVYDPFQAALARRLRAAQIPYVVSVHGGLQEAAQSRRRMKKFLGDLFFFDTFLRGALAVHALQASEQENARRRTGGRTFLLPNAVPAALATEAAAAPAPPAGPVRFGFLGRIETKIKGLDLLLEAAALLEKRRPDLDLRFSVAGPFHTPADGALARSLHARLTHPERLEFLGPVSGPEKWRTLASFDVFVQLSRSEGMPAAVLEAMAFGKPCILTPGTNLQDALRECDGGWLCAADPEAASRALEAAATATSEERKARGARARTLALARYTWDAVAGDYEKRVEELMMGASGLSE